MAQFDVHRNSGRHSDAIPYVVVVQSALYDGYRRRVIIPLVRRADLKSVSFTQLNPTFVIEGLPVVLHPLEMVSVATKDLGPFVLSLAEHSQDIAGALDELLTRAYG